MITCLKNSTQFISATFSIAMSQSIKKGKRPHSASTEQPVEKKHKFSNKKEEKLAKIQLDGHTIIKNNYRFEIN